MTRSSRSELHTSYNDYRLSRGLWAVALAFLSLGGMLTLEEAPPGELPQLSSAVASVDAGSDGFNGQLSESAEYLAKPIRELRPIVDRVLADNPETAGQAESDFGEIDPSEWRLLELRMPEGDGGELQATVARPLDWIDAVLGENGGRVPIENEELGITGFADVVDTRACPAPKQDDGRLVTAVYRHSRANVIDVHVAGEPEPIGTTANHPFWSEDRQSFVEAGSLQPGETVRLASDRLSQIENVGTKQRTETVYNLEVDGEHVFYVGLTGILVHNAGAYCAHVRNSAVHVVGQGSTVRKVGLRSAIDPKWGLTKKHLNKHFFGNSKFALKKIDPGGTADKWKQHLADLYNAPVTGTTSNGMLDIVKTFQRADGSGSFKMGIRLFDHGDGTFDLVTVLTKQ